MEKEIEKATSWDSVKANKYFYEIGIKTHPRDESDIAAKELHCECLNHCTTKEELIYCLKRLINGNFKIHDGINNDEEYKRVYVGFANKLLDDIQIGLYPYKM